MKHPSFVTTAALLLLVGCGHAVADDATSGDQALTASGQFECQAAAVEAATYVDIAGFGNDELASGVSGKRDDATGGETFFMRFAQNPTGYEVKAHHDSTSHSCVVDSVGLGQNNPHSPVIGTDKNIRCEQKALDVVAHLDLARAGREDSSSPLTVLSRTRKERAPNGPPDPSSQMEEFKVQSTVPGLVYDVILWTGDVGGRCETIWFSD